MSINYIAKGMLYHSSSDVHNKDTHNNAKFFSVPCGAIENYKKNLDSIKRRKEWKTTGVGAEFMGIERYDDQKARENIAITDFLSLDENECIYVAKLDDGTAIYKKSLTDLEKSEAVVLRKENLVVHDIDFDSKQRRLILSSGLPYDYECHLSILYLDNTTVQYVTEGNCRDANPVFDTTDSDIIFYDSCGFAFDNKARLMSGPKSIYKLNLKTGDLDTIIDDDEFDYFKPQFDADGNLYCLKRPYKGRLNTTGFSSIKDIIFAPAKIIKAVVGWLDFFTQRYTGESLKSSGGRNPAKSRQKSTEELFIEGNLIKAQENLDANQQLGDKFPGMIPKSWELIKINNDGSTTSIKKGVMGFCIDGDMLLYSNGKYLLSIDKEGTEKMLTEDKLIQKIRT